MRCTVSHFLFFFHSYSRVELRGLAEAAGDDAFAPCKQVLLAGGDAAELLQAELRAPDNGEGPLLWVCKKMW